MAVEPSMNAARPKRRAIATGKLVGTRFQAHLLEAIDNWRKEQVDLPTRPEAVRRLIELGMARSMNAAEVSSTRIAKRNSDAKKT